MSARGAAVAVVDARRRFAARRRIGRSRTWRRAVVVLVAVLLVLGGGWVVLNSSLADVRTVTVEGTSRLSAAEVLRAAHVTGGTPLFRLDVSAVAARVSRLPAVRSVDVSRHWPHGVVIEVTERKPVARLLGQGDPTLLDDTGVPFAPAAAAAADTLLPVRVGATCAHVTAPATEPCAAAAMRLLGALPPDVRALVVGVVVHARSDLVLQLDGGRIVRWGSATGSVRKAAVLQPVLRRKARVYDVSAPRVVVTR